MIVLALLLLPRGRGSNEAHRAQSRIVETSHPRTGCVGRGWEWVPISMLPLPLPRASGCVPVSGPERTPCSVRDSARCHLVCLLISTSLQILSLDSRVPFSSEFCTNLVPSQYIHT